MRRIAWGTLLAVLLGGTVHAQVGSFQPERDCHTTLFGGTTCTQQAASVPTQATPSAPVANTCRFGIGAAARLMCADPKLAALDLAMVKAYRRNMEGIAPDKKKVLLAEQAEWIRQRNQKCGLAGEDNAPLDQIRPAAQCMMDEIKERTEALQSEVEKTDANNSDPCQSAKTASERLICADPDLADADLALSKVYQDAEKAAPLDVRTRLAQEQLTWVHGRDAKCGLIGKDAVPIDELREAKPCMEGEMKARFAALLTAYRGKSSSPAGASAGPAVPANSQAAIISPAVETGALADRATSPRNSPALHVSTAAQEPGGASDTDLSRARMKLAADLGIQRWIDLKQLARNPYFYKDTVVGVVLSFERSISKHEAIFALDNNQVFVAGVPSTPLLGVGEIVLAGRVKGNKGVIDNSGNEAIFPALDYVGRASCGSQCEALAKLNASEKQLNPTAALEQ
jgi:uncharacterized protein YecT (DUF1311 family)